MRFLRMRHNHVESMTTNEIFTPEEKRNAVFVLKGCIVIARHPFEECSTSEPGNCWCAREESSLIHQVVVDEES